MAQILIRKARKPTHAVIAPTFGEPSTDVYRNIASISNRLQEGFAALTVPLGDGSLRDALGRGDVDAIVRGLDWVGFVTAANAIMTPIRHTLASFGKLEVTPEEKRRPLRKAVTTVTVPTSAKAMKHLFSDIDQRAIDHAQQHAGKLIVSVSDETKAAVRDLVAKSMTGDLTVDQLGRKLRSVVPLRPDQQGAVDKLFQTAYGNAKDAWQAKNPLGSVSSDLHDAWTAAAQKVADKAAAQKLAQRSTLIARTEIVAASNQGRYLAWQSQVGMGLMADNSQKEWVAADGACPDCADLDGERVGWDEPFSTGDDMPPDHPACRCSAVTIPPHMQDGNPDPTYAGDYAPSGEASTGVDGSDDAGSDVGTASGLEDALAQVLGQEMASTVSSVFESGAAVDAAAAAAEDLTAPIVEDLDLSAVSDGSAKVQAVLDKAAAHQPISHEEYHAAKAAAKKADDAIGIPHDDEEAITAQLDGGLEAHGVWKDDTAKLKPGSTLTPQGKWTAPKIEHADAPNPAAAKQPGKPPAPATQTSVAVGAAAKSAAADLMDDLDTLAEGDALDVPSLDAAWAQMKASALTPADLQLFGQQLEELATDNGLAWGLKDDSVLAPNAVEEAAAAVPTQPKPKAAWLGSPVGGKTGQAIQDLQGKLYQGKATQADVDAAKQAVKTAMGVPGSKKAQAVDHIDHLVEHHGGLAVADPAAAAKAAAEKAAADAAAAQAKVDAEAAAAAEAKKLAAVNDAVAGYSTALNGDGANYADWFAAHEKLTEAGLTSDQAAEQLKAVDGGLTSGQLTSAQIHGLKLKPGASAKPKLGPGAVTGKAAEQIKDLEQKLTTGHATTAHVADAKAAIGKIPGLSGTKKLAAQDRLDEVVAHHGLDASSIATKPPTPKELGDWKDQPAPVKPTAPEPPPVVGKSAFDEWLAETKQRYADFAAKTGNPKTKLEQSLNWPNVVQVIEHGDMGALASLKQNQYIDQAGYDKAVAAIKASKQPLPGTEAPYLAAVKQYERDLAEHDANLTAWRTANGITVKLQGMDSARMFTDNYAGVDWANAHLPVPSGSGLTAIKKYTGSSYVPWNNALRRQATDGPISGEWAEDTRKADAGFTPLPENIMVFRGTGWDEFAFPDGTRTRQIPPPAPHDLIGSVQVQHGYMSTSVGTTAAFGGSVQMRIMAPAGHPAAWIAPKSNFVSEREMLMSRGTQLFIHDVYKKGSQWIVEAEILPPGMTPAELAGHETMPAVTAKP